MFRGWLDAVVLRRVTLASGVGLVALAASWFLLLELDREIGRIQVEGELTVAERRAVREKIATVLMDNSARLHSIDLGVIREAVVGLTWTERVRIRRQWPDTLRVQLSKRGVAARWGDGGFVATNGSLIEPAANLSTDDLPLLDCALSSAARAMEVYQLLSTRLSQVGLSVEELRESQLGEWTIGLRGGFSVVLGKDDLADRLNRFLAVYEVDLGQRLDEVMLVDARYHNGIAVSWASQTAELAATQTVQP